jgi:hypothetical protein
MLADHQLWVPVSPIRAIPDVASESCAGSVGPVMESGNPGVDRRRTRARARARICVRAGLVSACIAVLVFHAGHGSRITHDLVAGTWRDRAESAEDQLRCLAERVQEVVPPGSRVHVGPGPGVELRQRISELVMYADSQVVSDPTAADLVLDSHTATAPTGQSGQTGHSGQSGPSGPNAPRGPSCRGVTLGVVDAT